MVRRLKKDVLKDLPPKRRQVILLPADTLATKHMLKVEKELLKTEDELNVLRATVESLSVNQADNAYKKAVQALADAEGVAFNATAEIRHQTALAKLPSAMDYLINVLENEDKIVVFTHHRDDMIDPIVEGLAEYGVVKMDGRDNLAQRQAAVHTFQTDPKIRVIVGTMAVMGVGHTLHAASYVAFIELDWVPGNMAQAEDRLHRIGQKNSILVQHIMLDGSFDGRMAKTVLAKMNVIERAVG
jgi:SWI/SNF-related matrix-associated actin-dependent regulator 1 of chromatin subfamily A